MIYPPIYLVDIISHRYNKSHEEIDCFNKFIALWISFNAFYSIYKKGQDRGNLEEFSKFNQGLYDQINKVKVKSFFDEIQCKTRKGIIGTGGIINVEKYEKHINDTTTISKQDAISKYILKDFSNIDSLKEFIFCIYQIRCNLFHGDKSPHSAADKKIVKMAYKALDEIINKIYPIYSLDI